MDIMTKEERSERMKKVKYKDTQIEILLRQALWHNGIHYRKNYKLFNCHPDIAITKYKIAIFCDGSFWHGYRNIDKCSNYWKQKIQRNIERDLENTITLRDNDWIVLRFSEKQIKANLNQCLLEIKSTISLLKNQKHISRTQGNHRIQKRMPPQKQLS